MIISVSNLSKHYKVAQKEEGLKGSIKSLINRQYETVKAVEGISFEIEEGELVGFIGPNGAGKTTTLKCLSGLLYPTGGKISVLGYDPYKRKSEFLKQISLVMGQKNQLWWDLPPIDSFRLQQKIYDVPSGKYEKTLSELVDLMKVKNEIKTPVKKLSLGQRMKMELIGQLIYNPKVLFLDEPTIGLDVVMQKNLRDFIKGYNEKYNSTVILTSHYMKDVEELCRRVIIISSGKIIYDGLLSELIKKFSKEKVIRFASKDQAKENLLRGYGKLNREGDRFVLSVENSKVSDVVSAILKDFKIEDLTIEDAEIEDIIRNFFSKNG